MNSIRGILDKHSLSYVIVREEVDQLEAELQAYVDTEVAKALRRFAEGYQKPYSQPQWWQQTFVPDTSKVWCVNG